MLDHIFLFCTTYLAVGVMFTMRCKFAPGLPGWRGQAAVACATFLMSAIWPVLAWYGARARLRRLLG